MKLTDDNAALRILDAWPNLNNPPRRTGESYNANDARRIIPPTVPHSFRNETLFILRTLEREFADYVLAEQAKHRYGNPERYRRAVYRTKQRYYSVVSFDWASARLDYLETVDTLPAARKALRRWARS